MDTAQRKKHPANAIVQPLRNQITIGIYLKPDEFDGAYNSIFFQSELTTFLTTVKKLQSAFISLEIPSPTYCIQYMLIPRNWMSYEEENIDHTQNSAVFNAILTELKSALELTDVDIRLEEVEINPIIDINYFTDVNQSDGNLLDFVKFRALAYIGEHENMNHAQMDANTIIPDPVAFVRQTFGQIKPKEQFVVSVYSRSAPHYSITSKVMFIPNTTHSTFRAELQSLFNEHIANEDSQTAELHLFKKVYKVALKKINLLHRENFSVIFSHHTIPYFDLSALVLIEVKKTWNGRAIGYLLLETNTLPLLQRKHEIAEHKHSLYVNDKKALAFYDEEHHHLYRQKPMFTVNAFNRVIKKQYPSSVLAGEVHSLDASIAKELRHHFEMPCESLDPMKELQLPENSIILTGAIANIPVSEGRIFDCSFNIYTFENLLYKRMTPLFGLNDATHQAFFDRLSPVDELIAMKAYVKHMVQCSPQACAFIWRLVDYVHLKRRNQLSTLLKNQLHNLEENVTDLNITEESAVSKKSPTVGESPTTVAGSSPGRNTTTPASVAAQDRLFPPATFKSLRSPTATSIPAKKNTKPNAISSPDFSFG